MKKLNAIYLSIEELEENVKKKLKEIIPIPFNVFISNYDTNVLKITISCKEDIYNYYDEIDSIFSIIEEGEVMGEFGCEFDPINVLEEIYDIEIHTYMTNSEYVGIMY